MYRTKQKTKNDRVSYGINMFFKQPHEFSEDANQGGGELAQSQTVPVMKWGSGGCPIDKQENLTDYVTMNMKNVVFCRYGLDYLHEFPRDDDIAIGSFRINLDYLICQKQKFIDQDFNNNIIGMSFLKTKGQLEMNR